MSNDELIEIAQKAAEKVDGLGPVLDVAVKGGLGSEDEPVCRC